MSNQSYLSLPPVPPVLKSIVIFLQRADELKAQDPVVAYWCAYYAAQQGISLKATSHASRSFLSALLTALESLRATIGPSEAIDVESVSSVYIEDFALRVFNVADNEDRNGKATRVTAKKFLAAAAFLEVLKTFDDKRPWETHADKARYAKWKASDIAKAFREGRVPQSGPSGSNETRPEGVNTPSTQQMPTTHPVLPNASSAPASVEPTQLASQFIGSPSAPFNDDDRSSGNRDVSNPYPSNPPTTVTADSTTDSLGPMRHPGTFQTIEPHNGVQMGLQSPSSTFVAQGTSLLPTVGEEQVYTAVSASPPQFNGSTMMGNRHTRTGSNQSGIPSSPILPAATAGHGRTRTNSTSSASSNRATSPTHFVPRDSPSASQTSFAPSVFPHQNVGSSNYPSHWPSQPSQSLPSLLQPSAPPQSSVSQPSQSITPVELAPSLIAKVQKHCRFAISALDYEDAEQARKELRTALALLGDR